VFTQPDLATDRIDLWVTGGERPGAVGQRRNSDGLEAVIPRRVREKRDALLTYTLDASGGPRRGVGAFAKSKPTAEAGLRALAHRRLQYVSLDWADRCGLRGCFAVLEWQLYGQSRLWSLIRIVRIRQAA
jgi:hypothetical protein